MFDINNSYKMNSNTLLALGLTLGMGFYTGNIYQNTFAEQKIPCITNYKEVFFGKHLQELLNDTDTQWENGLTSREAAVEIIQYGDNPEERGSVFTVELGNTEVEYYVPSYCYAELTMNGLRRPILWRK